MSHLVVRAAKPGQRRLRRKRKIVKFRASDGDTVGIGVSSEPNKRAKLDVSGAKVSSNHLDGDLVTARRIETPELVVDNLTATNMSLSGDLAVSGSAAVAGPSALGTTTIHGNLTLVAEGPELGDISCRSLVAAGGDIKLNANGSMVADSLAAASNVACAGLHASDNITCGGSSFTVDVAGEVKTIAGLAADAIGATRIRLDDGAAVVEINEGNQALTVASTTRGSIPAPLMSEAEWSAIADVNKPQGLMVFTTDDQRVTVCDVPAGEQKLAYYSDIVQNVYPFWGNGYEGNMTFNGSGPFASGFTRDIYANNVTLAAGFKQNTASFRLFVSGTLTILAGGYFANDGKSAGDGVTADRNGAAGNPDGSTMLGSFGGGDGGFGAPITGNPGGDGEGYNNNFGLGGIGDNGGPNNIPPLSPGYQPGGSGGQWVTLEKQTAMLADFNLLHSLNYFGLGQFRGGWGGGGGGGSGGANGGGGGGGGGIVFIAAKTIDLSQTSGVFISARGGNGGAAQDPTGGAGGGGGGGAVILVYENIIGTFDPTAQILVNVGEPGLIGVQPLARDGTTGHRIIWKL